MEVETAAPMDVEPSHAANGGPSNGYLLPDITDEDTLVQLRTITSEKARKQIVKQMVVFQKYLKENKLEEARLILDICLKEIDDTRILALKSRYASRTVSQEVERYQQQQSWIEAEMKMAQDNIEGLKRRLESAQQERKNKAEYDELAKRILKIPERTENERQIQQLKEELVQLHKEETELEEEWEFRRKHFQLLLLSAHQLKTLIADSKEQAEADAARDLEKPLATLNTPLEAPQEEEEGAVDPAEAMDVS